MNMFIVRIFPCVWQYTLQPWYWSALFYGLISSGENSEHFLQLKSMITIQLCFYHQVPIITAPQNTIHQVTTMLATSKNVLFPGHNHLLTTGTGWMDEWCFRPLFCTIKAELGRGQPGLMRWSWDETLPQCSIDARPSTLQPTTLQVS